MSMDTAETTVEILGKPYQIKCPQSEVNALQRAAQLLEEQMRSMRTANNMLSSDKILVAAALNIAHQLLVLENKTLREAETIQQRFTNLQGKIDKALIPPCQMELTPAE